MCENAQPNKDIAEITFCKTIKRNHEGRYIVELPLKEEIDLDDSRSGAVKRFYALENKLNRDEHLKEQYIDFINEYIELNHMTKSTNKDNDDYPNFFLSHHAILNESSSTMKLRRDLMD